MLTQMEQKDIAELRNTILEEQDGVCPICNTEITEQTGVSLDHQHMTSKEEIGQDGAGLIRGVLCRACNVWEGKIWNNTSRYKQPTLVQDRIKLLLNLIEYYRAENYQYIHPSEKPKESKVSKRNYNALKKKYAESKKRAKFPEYPKSGKLIKKLELLFEEFNINPFNP